MEEEKIKRPDCFKKFYRENSEFCNKVCRHFIGCSGKEISEDEIDEVKRARENKIIDQKEFYKYGMEAIRKRVKKSRKVKYQLSTDEA